MCFLWFSPANSKDYGPLGLQWMSGYKYIFYFFVKIPNYHHFQLENAFMKSVDLPHKISN